jgi:hypothetical protein
VADVVESLMAVPGVVAVARATGRAAEEPAYLLYYRGTFDPAELRKLELQGDVIRRDLDAVEHWVAEAGEGRFEIDAADGWLAGRPTYVLVGELATCEVLAGELPRPEFPAALREPAALRWREAVADVLAVAESRASRGDVAGCVGLLAKATVATAHARLAERGEWVLGEAGIVRRAGLDRTGSILAATGDRPFELGRAISRMRVALGLTGGKTAAEPNLRG